MALLMTEEANPKLAEDVSELVSTIELTEDLAVLSWAASALATSVLKVAPLDDYVDAFTEFGCPECTKYLPETWQSSPAAEKRHDVKIPRHASSSIARRIRTLSQGVNRPDGISETEWNALASLFSVLLELTRIPLLSQSNTHPRTQRVRELLMQDSKLPRGFLHCIAQLMRSSGEGNKSASADTAFVNSCLFLANLSTDDADLSKQLRKAGISEIVAGRLLQETHTRRSSGLDADAEAAWRPFATACAQLLELLIQTARPHELLKGQTEALLAVLTSSLGNHSHWPGACMVVQLMHLNALRGLTRVASHHPQEAQRMVKDGGFDAGARLLKINGHHEEAHALTFRFLCELVVRAPDHAGEARGLGLQNLVEQVLSRYNKFPGAAQGLHAEGTRLVSLLSGSELDHSASSPIAADESLCAEEPVFIPKVKAGA